jgi:hypothetical protein
MAWNDTQEGANLDQSWRNLLDVYNNTVPGHVQQLNNASNRPITG